MRIVFFGTPDFAAQILRFLVAENQEIVGVVTRTDKPKGRSLQLAPPPVKEAALELLPNVYLYQPLKASTPEFIDRMRALNPDLFVVVAYGEIMTQELLDVPKIACINIHASLLPKYRGAAPIQRAIMEGEEESGVTIMHMVKKLDAGPMVNQVRVPITLEMTAGELHDKLIAAGCTGLKEALKEFTAGTVRKTPQNEAHATYAKKLTPEDGRLDFTQSAKEVYNTYRGTTPFPGAWCWVSIRGETKRLKVEKCAPVAGVEGSSEKILVYGKEGIVISCTQEALRLDQVKLEGKKSVSAEEFTRGFNRDDIAFL